MASELSELGHTVVTAGWREQQAVDIRFPWRCSVSDFLELLPPGFTPDCFIYYDDSSLPCFIDFENLHFTKIFYSVDTHHHLEWHKEFAKLFDLTLVAQKDFVEELKHSLGERVRWFPLWATRMVEPQKEKSIDVCFRGTMDEGLHPGRLKFLQGVAAHVNLDFDMGDYTDPYSRAKIVINEAVRGDVNFRVFEGMMSGALMITPKLGNGLFDLFEDGENLSTFEDGDIEDAVRKIKYYLENDAERIKVSEAGRRLILEKHSAKPIAKSMGVLINEAILSSAPYLNLPTISLHASVVRYLWLFVRKYNYQNMQAHLVNMLEYLDGSFRAKQVEFEQGEQTTDVSIIVLDSLMADLLDKVSYQVWLRSMSTASDGKVPLIDHLVFAFSDESESNDSDSLKAVFTQNRERFISSLSEFVSKGPY